MNSHSTPCASQDSSSLLGVYYRPHETFPSLAFPRQQSLFEAAYVCWSIGRGWASRTTSQSIDTDLSFSDELSWPSWCPLWPSSAAVLRTVQHPRRSCIHLSGCRGSCHASLRAWSPLGRPDGHEFEQGPGSFSYLAACSWRHGDFWGT